MSTRIDPPSSGSSHRSRWHHRLRLAAAAIALLSSLALLVADSDGPHCETAAPLPYSVYDYTLTCPEVATGRIRLETTYSYEDGWVVDMEDVSGDGVVTGVDVYGSCTEDGGTEVADSLSFHRIGTAAVCEVLLPDGLGQEVECADHSAANPCMIVIEGIE